MAKIPQGTHEISLYDPYFKEGASITGWDWRWIAALAHQESKFNPNATSWSGARGLMQLVPGTAYKLGAKSKNEMMDPEINVKLACKYLRILSASFSNVQQEDRIKFVLARQKLQCRCGPREGCPGLGWLKIWQKPKCLERKRGGICKT